MKGEFSEREHSLLSEISQYHLTIKEQIIKLNELNGKYTEISSKLS